jgi:hypothetical protein
VLFTYCNVVVLFARKSVLELGSIVLLVVLVLLSGVV